MSATFGGFNLLRREDFASTAFICNGANLLEPTIFKTTSLTGNGSGANPLAVKISTDPGNDIIFGGDGGIFFNETVTTLVGNNITSAFTYTNEAGAITTLRRVSADVGNTITIGSDGGAYLAASAFSFSITDGSTTQLISNGDTITFTGTGLVTAVVSAIDTVTINVAAPVLVAECPGIPYFVGTPP